MSETAARTSATAPACASSIFETLCAEAESVFIPE